MERGESFQHFLFQLRRRTFELRDLVVLVKSQRSAEAFQRFRTRKLSVGSTHVFTEIKIEYPVVRSVNIDIRWLGSMGQSMRPNHLSNQTIKHDHNKCSSEGFTL